MTSVIPVNHPTNTQRMNCDLRILQVSTSDSTGGAHKVAYNLHRAYQAYGYPASTRMTRISFLSQMMLRVARGPSCG